MSRFQGQRIRELESEKEQFDWIPVLSCQTESEAPTATYTRQIGTGIKIRIKENLSIVFVSLYIRATITAVSSGNNYACIAGLPYTNSSSGASFNFNNFYRGIDDTHDMPVGYFAGKTIRVQSTAIPQRGGSVERWTVGDGVAIQGSGFYFTNE